MSLTHDLGQALATLLNSTYAITHYFKKQKFQSNQIKSIISPLAFNIQDGSTRCGRRYSIDYYISIQSLKQNYIQHFETVQNLMITAGAVSRLQVGTLVYHTKEVQNISTIDWDLVAESNVLKSQIVIKMQVK